jgi:hypothetical protein
MNILNQSEVNNLSTATAEIALTSAVAYGICALTGLANPLAGALFLGTARAADYITKPVFIGLFNQNQKATLASKALGQISRVTLNVCCGIKIVQTAGLSLPVVGLNLSSSLTKLASIINTTSLPILASVIILASLMSYSFIALSQIEKNKNV